MKHSVTLKEKECNVIILKIIKYNKIIKMKIIKKGNGSAGKMQISKILSFSQAYATYRYIKIK